MKPPLPQLSGAPPSHSTKRTRAALALSYTGAALLITIPLLLLLLFVWGGRNSSTVLFTGREINMDLIAAPFVFGSMGCSLAGFLIGAATRKNNGSKAFTIGGITLLIWLLIAGVIGTIAVRQFNTFYFGRCIR